MALPAICASSAQGACTEPTPKVCRPFAYRRDWRRPAAAVGASALQDGDAPSRREAAGGCVPWACHLHAAATTLRTRVSSGETVLLAVLVLRRPRPPAAERPVEQRQGLDDVRVGRALHLSCSVERKDALEGLAGGEEGEEVVVVGAGDDLPEHVVGEQRDVRHDEW